MLCEERLGVKSYTHIVIPSTEIPDEALPGLQEDMRRLLASEPLQYVLGFTMFYGRRFNVTPDVLIPRPETELLVDEAVKAGLALGRKLRVLDLCTGSGCIAWSLFQELQDAEVVAATKAAGFDNLKGHKSVGGLRASIYNAMPKEGVEALVEFLKQYEAEHA